MTNRIKGIISWSSGKDSAYALHAIRKEGEIEVVGLLTTVTRAYNRVSMHGVREELLDRQAEEMGLPCIKIDIPSPCPNELYEQEMARTLAGFKSQGVTHVVFGDIFLRDLREYREARLAEAGMHGVFPLWLRDTVELAHEMLDIGMRATVTCIDLKKLDRSFAGLSYDKNFLRALPHDADPCGENGEFHTFVSAGPMFCEPIEITIGEIVERDGFVFADVLPSVARI